MVGSTASPKLGLRLTYSFATSKAFSASALFSSLINTEIVVLLLLIHLNRYYAIRPAIVTQPTASHLNSNSRLINVDSELMNILRFERSKPPSVSPHALTKTVRNIDTLGIRVLCITPWNKLYAMYFMLGTITYKRLCFAWSEKNFRR